MAQRRVYIIIQGHEPVDQEVFTSLKKLAEDVGEDLSYQALSKRLQRAKERTGKSVIRMKDKEGKPITIQIQELE